MRPGFRVVADRRTRAHGSFDQGSATDFVSPIKAQHAFNALRLELAVADINTLLGDHHPGVAGTYWCAPTDFQSTGRESLSRMPDSRQTPSRFGPRHWGQSSGLPAGGRNSCRFAASIPRSVSRGFVIDGATPAWRCSLTAPRNAEAGAVMFLREMARRSKRPRGNPVVSLL